MKEIELLNPGNAGYIIVVMMMVLVIVLGYKKKNKFIQVFKLSYIKGFQRLKIVLMVLGFILIFVALLGPAQEDGLEQVTSEGLDIYVLLDTSKSMLAEDMAPSRIELAKSLLMSLLEDLNGDRIGFIPFSSTAYVQMPLTDDYDLAKMFVNVMDTEMISGGGSDVGYAIQVAMDAFDEASQGDQVILILSDGEEHDDHAAEVIQSMSSSQIKIFAIGIGTTQGGLIPEYSLDGKEKLGYKKTADGQTVMSKLNESMLIELARATDGQYYNGQSIMSNTDSVITDILKLKRGNLTSKSVIHYKHLYQFALGLGMVLFLTGILLPERSQGHE